MKLQDLSYHAAVWLIALPLFCLPARLGAAEAEPDVTMPESPVVAGEAATGVAPVQGAIVEEDLGALDDRLDASGSDDRAGAFAAELGQPSGLAPVEVVALLSDTIYGARLNYPESLFYDRFTGEIYATFAGSNTNERVIVYDKDYYPVASFGAGRQVPFTYGLAVDKTGNIYLTIAGDKPLIRVLNAALFPVRDIPLDAIPGAGGGFTPRSIALNHYNGDIYVTGNRAVLLLDRDGNFKRWIVPVAGAAGHGVSNDLNDQRSQLGVNDVMVDTTGRIYLLMRGIGSIFVLDRDENFLFSFGQPGGSTGKLSIPVSIAADVERRVLYIADYMRHMVNVYDYDDGGFLFEFGGQGSSGGWFQFPAHVDVDRNHNLIVADKFNHRIQILSLQ